MKKMEIRRFIALAKRLESKGESIKRRTQKLYSKPDTGNDDELWQKCFRDAGFSNGLLESSQAIRQLIFKIQKRAKK